MEVDPGGSRVKSRKTLGYEAADDPGQNIPGPGGRETAVPGRIDPDFPLGMGDDGETSF